MGTPMLGSHFWTKVENKVAEPNFWDWAFSEVAMTSIFW